MKKVAILKSNLSQKGGLEKYTWRIAEAFADQGCHVDILTTHCPQTSTASKKPFEIVNLPCPSKIAFRRIRHYEQLCQQWIDQNCPDIIFGMDRNRHQTHYRAGNGVHAEYLRKRAKTDSLFKRLSFRINPLHLEILSAEKEAFEDPQLQVLFTNSDLVKQDILRHYQTDPQKIQVVHNGVEWHEMQAPFDDWTSKQAEVLMHRGLDPSAFQFLFIGKGYRRKGLQYLLEGLSALKEHHFQLSVVGHDKEINTFRNLARSLGLENRVKFFGAREDVYEFYKGCDVLAIPSTYDPFANVTIEALAMGLYVLSSQFNGGAEILTPFSGTVIKELDDHDSFVEALKQCFKHCKSPLSARAIRDSVKHLDFSIQLNKIVSIALESHILSL